MDIYLFLIFVSNTPPGGRKKSGVCVSSALQISKPILGLLIPPFCAYITMVLFCVPTSISVFLVFVIGNTPS